MSVRLLYSLHTAHCDYCGSHTCSPDCHHLPPRTRLVRTHTTFTVRSLYTVLPTFPMPRYPLPAVGLVWFVTVETPTQKHRLHCDTAHAHTWFRASFPCLPHPAEPATCHGWFWRRRFLPAHCYSSAFFWILCRFYYRLVVAVTVDSLHLAAAIVRMTGWRERLLLAAHYVGGFLPPYHHAIPTYYLYRYLPPLPWLLLYQRDYQLLPQLYAACGSGGLPPSSRLQQRAVCL